MIKLIKYNTIQLIRLIGQIIVDNRLFNLPGLFNIRIGVYKLLFNIKGKFHAGHKVYFNREHKKFDGSIKIHNNVLFSYNIHVDYTDFLEIKDFVRIASGVHILTHHRDLEALKQGEDVNIQTSLLIEENVYIGSNAVILSTCNYIGKNSRIGAGAVVTKDVPDNVLVGGVPAKIIKHLDKDE